MPAAARIGDPTTCGDTMAAGSGNVFVNGIPVVRLGDSTAGHPHGPPTPTNSGSGSVFVNNLPVCMVGSTIVPHTHPGSISVGSSDVIIN